MKAKRGRMSRILKVFLSLTPRPIGSSVDDTKNDWAHNVTSLIGQKAKIAIGGDPQYQRGETSIALYTYDK